MITFETKGDLHKTRGFLNGLRSRKYYQILDKYGKMGVEALSAATPVRSGLTASSWEYKIEQSKTGATISFNNTNINDGVNIALIIQYGHGTGWGGYVRGIDYINPAIAPVFQQMAEEVWKEVVNA